MKLKIIILIILALITSYLYVSNNHIKNENERLKLNQEILIARNDALLNERKKLKIYDSLNAMKTSALQLTVDEYKKLKARDNKLIRQLKINSSDLQSVVNAQTIMIDSMRAKLNVYVNLNAATQQLDTVRCFDYKSKWIDIQGCLVNDTVNLHVENRESIKIIESVSYKRFLGFLWKTNKVKSRDVSVVSENPATTITNIEYINVN